MKTEINKSVKRTVSMVIAVALLLGTLFTTNVGIGIKADAATTESKTVVYLTSADYNNPTGVWANVTGAGTEADPYIIKTPGQLRYIVQNSTYESTNGKFYKMDPTIGTMVLQTEAYIKAVAGSLDAFLALDATATKDALSTSSNRTHWNSGSSAANYNGFAGTFDFSGVTICGMYNQNGGLFACARSAKIKNLIVSNNYITSGWYNGNIIGMVSNGSTGENQDNNVLAINTVEVKNCYQYTSGNGYNNTGVLIGVTNASKNIQINIQNVFTHDNVSKATTSSSDSTLVDCALYGNLPTAWNGLGTDNPNAYYNNIVTLDCVPYPTQTINNQSTRPEYWHNVYSAVLDSRTPCTWYQNDGDWAKFDITKIDAANAVGVNAKLTLTGLNWATDTTDGTWYVLANGYPTLFKPEGWQDIPVPSFFSGSAAASFESGTGTQADPYIIKNADQLYKMVTSSGKLSDGITAYYKVADGVEKIYVNNVVLNETLAGVKALVSSGNYKNWNTTTEFFGNFDGNGVTISGLVSYNAKGFVAKMSGASVVKNVNFENCYAYGSAAVAIVTTAAGAYTDAANKPVIANVSVRKSHIESTKAQGIAAKTTTNASYSVTDGGVTYVAGDQTSTAGTYYIKNNSTGKVVYDVNGVTAGGIAAISDTAAMFTVKNCMFDGDSCELLQPNGTVDNTAGILSLASWVNNVTISNCVSLGAPVVSEAVGPNGEEIFYNRYNSKTGYKFYVENCYSNVALKTTNKSGAAATTYWSIYDRPSKVKRVAKATVYTRDSFMLLDWGGTWRLAAVEDGRTIPMPKVLTSSIIQTDYTNYSAMLAGHNNLGLKSGTYPNQTGEYGWFTELTGSGSATDPYIIDSAEKLAIAIATGGKNLNDKLYYKLACDIDLGSLSWIEDKVIGGEYRYAPFVGTLDGDGHTVSGLSSVNESAPSGLILKLDGGTVKNLHMRNCYAASGDKAGVIVGSVTANGGTIEGCSIEESYVINSSNAFAGSALTVKNSYCTVDGTSTYYVADGTVGTPTDFYSSANKNAAWYKGSTGTPHLVNFAKAREYADIDGDGVADGYTTNDLVALRNCLLGKADYKNVYGDVSGNGVTNIGDLAILRRALAGSYDSTKDGFWRNAELGKVKIYYAENDTQDMARKLELYIESVIPEIDVVKVPGTAVTDTAIASSELKNYANEENAIVITKTLNTSAYANYSVSYDKAKNITKINGNSFTAVEQATLDLIAQLRASGNTADPKNITGTLAAEKNARTVNGTTYYYAWGDEFADENGTGTYNADTWSARMYKNEGAELNGKTVDQVTNSTRYLNLENPNVENLKDLWQVNDGKLHIWRGINTDVYTGSANYSWGYKGVAAGKAGTTNDYNCQIDSDDIYVDPGILSTNKTMMFKQGYAEMRASLPSDGHAFPAWWFMTGTNTRGNRSLEQELYSKVYKLNSKYDGSSANITPGNLNTYKYQVPQAMLEYDIVEFMQAADSGATTGKYRDYINLTIHKWYDQNASGDTLYIPNWNAYTTTAISSTNFKTTAGTGSFIHRYNPDNTTSPYAHTYTTGSWFWEREVNTAASYSIEQAISKGKLASGKTVTDYYTYGFSWNVDAENNTYKLVVYVDFNEDGVMADSEKIFELDQTNAHESTDPIYNNGSTHGVSDADIWNQYAYMLLDNSYYTSNPTGSNGKVKAYTDLLTQSSGHGTSGATDKTTFDIEYVRVYQQDGKRDIITKETEKFNTGNHFGY